MLWSGHGDKCLFQEASVALPTVAAFVVMGLDCTRRTRHSSVGYVARLVAANARHTRARMSHDCFPGGVVGIEPTRTSLGASRIRTSGLAVVDSGSGICLGGDRISGIL